MGFGDGCFGFLVQRPGICATVHEDYTRYGTDLSPDAATYIPSNGLPSPSSASCLTAVLPVTRSSHGCTCPNPSSPQPSTYKQAPRNVSYQGTSQLSHHRSSAPPQQQPRSRPKISKRKPNSSAGVLRRQGLTSTFCMRAMAIDAETRIPSS